jgi:hypothetical protein
MKTKPESNPQQTAQLICSITCECRGKYIGEIGRSLAVRLREYRHDLKDFVLKIFKITQHAYE